MKKVCLFWLISFSAFLSASAADAKLEPSGEIMKKELTHVIESQLAAFRQEDYEKAAQVRDALRNLKTSKS